MPRFTTFHLCLAVAATASTTSAAQSPRVPAFADFHVDSTYHGPVAPVNLKSNPRAPRFRTVLRQGAGTGPNFAGHLTVVAWGCGTSCIEIALVDARSGRVFTSPVGAGYGVDYKLDSRLLVIDRVPCADTVDAGVPDYAYFMEWTGRSLQLRDSLPNAKICAP